MPPMIGPTPKEKARKASPMGPAGILVPKIVINRYPVKKNRAIEVNIAPPNTKKKAVIFLALLGSYLEFFVGIFQMISAIR